MDTDTITERSGSCSCDAEVTRTESLTYTVAPAHCVIITQHPNQRYVQMMLGQGHARLEASSNEYLLGDFRLGASEEATLAALGFHHPNELGDDSGRPENWWINDDVADPLLIAQLLTATMCRVMAFVEREEVTIDLFGADSPCEACFWEAWMNAPDSTDERCVGPGPPVPERDNATVIRLSERPDNLAIVTRARDHVRQASGGLNGECRGAPQSTAPGVTSGR